jgi:RNA-binding protein YlmH
VFCLESVAGHIEDGLTQVRRTNVRVRRAENLPESVTAPPEETTLTAASERLDALVSAAFNLSRAESARLFEAERVFVNGLPAHSASSRPEEGDMVSVRGMGRFRFEGALGETRKGRLRVSLRIYGK